MWCPNLEELGKYLLLPPQMYGELLMSRSPAMFEEHMVPVVFLTIGILLSVADDVDVDVIKLVLFDEEISVLL